MDDVLQAAQVVAHAATGRALRAQLDAHRVALAALKRVNREQPQALAARRRALDEAHAAWLAIRVCWDLHFGVERLPC